MILETEELHQHPLHRAREVFFTIDGGQGVGPVLQVRTPIGTPTNPGPPPRLGQHSKIVLAEYGFTPEQIATLG